MDRTPRGLFAAIVLGLVLSACGGSVSGTPSSSSSQTEIPGVGDPNDSTFIDHTNAVGFYSDGSIEDSATLADEGPGYLKIFRLRKRAYATSTMARTIEIAAAAWRKQFPVGDRVQVGDITDWNGGTLSGHASHQNGLDADIAYLKTSQVERDPNTNGPNGFVERFVLNGKVTANFDMARNWAFLRNLVQRGNVGRIFMDPVLKKAFCKQAVTLDPTTPLAVRNEVLRRIRPLDGHADHFHLRIKCPTGHKKCVAQTEPPAGTGCSDVGASVAADEVDDRTPEQRADDILGLDEG